MRSQNLLLFTAIAIATVGGKFVSLDLGKATNKGTAMLKFAHQFQPDVILKR